MKKFAWFLLSIGLTSISIIGLSKFEGRSGEKIYKQYCATCHGANFQGGLGKSLTDGTWQFGNKDNEIVKNIKTGFSKNGMPPFKDALSESEILDLVAFIRLKEKDFKTPVYKVEEVVETFDYSVNVELVADDVEEPWGIAFLSNSKILITEKPGRLRIIENGKLLPNPVSGTPKVRYAGQGGMLDVAVDKEYEKNGWIYLSFSHDVDGDGMTKLVRGRIKNLKWINEEVLFEASEESYIGTKHHFGCRIVFDNEGHLYFSIGDRGKRKQAQDLSKPNGKIHRIFPDGSIPKDNPFADDVNALPSIYAYGSRNAQGLAIHPKTGELWESEHGQKGGDELNIIKSGNNYGWDKITYGRNYDGTVSTKYVKLKGIEVPILFWRPSIAVCGIDFHNGNLFKKWKNHLIVGALKFEEVRLLDIEDNRVIHQETILKDSGRVRDVSVAPDGSIFLALNQPDKIVRLIPGN